MARFEVGSELAGKEVISKDGRHLGEIRDVQIDASDWTVQAVVVRLARDVLDSLSLRKPFMGTQRIFVPAEHIGSVSDRMLLERTVAELADIISAEPDTEVNETQSTASHGNDEGQPRNNSRMKDDDSAPEGRQEEEGSRRKERSSGPTK